MKQEAQVIKWNCPCGNSYKFHGFTEAPQRPMECKPLTQIEVVEEFCKLPHDVQFVSVFEKGVRFAEAAHGIKGEA